MSDSFHGRNTVLLQTHFILEKTSIALMQCFRLTWLNGRIYNLELNPLRGFLLQG